MFPVQRIPKSESMEKQMKFTIAKSLVLIYNLDNKYSLT